jgi:hypothetical protein
MQSNQPMAKQKSCNQISMNLGQVPELPS